MGIYNKFTSRSLLAIVIGVSLSACGSWEIFRDKGNDYLQAKNHPVTGVPEGLDTPPYNDAMVIPDVVDSRGILGQQFELPLPEPLSSSYGVDRIVIRKLGENHWIFLDASTASIWPKLRDFFMDRNFTIETENPGEGMIETSWLLSSDGSADEVFASLSDGKAASDARAEIESKLRMQVESGVRQGSTEVRIEYIQAKIGTTNNPDLPWGEETGASAEQVLEIEDKFLSELAHYLGETINQSSTISLLAGKLGTESRTELIPDRVKPVLTYSLDFDRTWSTVGSALRIAGIEVEDRDRTSAVYYVLYRDRAEKSAGFFSRLFSSDDNVPKEEANRYMIKLDETEHEVRVTIHKNAEQLANPDFAERLLKIIKEYST